MKKKILFLLILFIPFMVSAYELEIDWQKSWGGNSSESFHTIISTQDGGFISIGSSKSTDIEGLLNKGGQDAIIVKYDNEGNMLWQKSWGGNSSDYFEKIISTDDGGLIAVGSTESTDISELLNKGRNDAIIVKYDNEGNILWQKSWGGSSSDSFDGIISIQDGGFIAYGTSQSTDINDLSINSSWGGDAIIVKYDKDGNMLWQKSWGGSSSDSFRGMLSIQDGGFITYGHTLSKDIDGLTNKGDTDCFIIKYDKDGNLLWQKSWGGNSYDYFYSMTSNQDGELIVVGPSQSTDIAGISNKGDKDAIIVKYDKDGNMLWQKSWGGNSSEYFHTIISTQDGGFASIGSSESTDIEGLLNKGGQDAIIVKYDNEGNLLWQKSWGGNGRDRFLEIILTHDGGFIVDGDFTSLDIEELPNKSVIIDDEEDDGSDTMILKYDNEGNLLWQKSWGGEGDECFNGITVTPNNEIAVVGVSHSNNIEDFSKNSYEGAIIVKYSFKYKIENIVNQNGSNIIEQQGSYGIVKPTPNEGYEVDKVIVKDKSGNVLDVEVTKQEDGTYSFELYTDVSVEVLFKEKLVNPKTGVSSFIGVIFTLMLIGISGFFMIRNCNNSYEL